MKTPIEALQEIKSRMDYFCAHTDGKYNPPWAQEIVGICDDILKYRNNIAKPFYVDVGTRIVAVRCASNHDVVVRYDHSISEWYIKLAEEACDRMNREAEIGKPLLNSDVGNIAQQTDRFFKF